MSNSHLRLVIMRHAKTERPHEAPSDHERALTKRGRGDAPRVAQRLDELGWVPDEVLCSDSMRTTETFERMAPAWSSTPTLHLSRRIYLASTSALLDVLRRAEGDTVMVVGHNPGLESLVQVLSGEPIGLTTGNAVLLRREMLPWKWAMDPDGWGLVDVIRPKEL